MKRNTANNSSAMSIRGVAKRLLAWVHLIIERKAEYFEACAWYPGTCQTEYPY